MRYRYLRRSSATSAYGLGTCSSDKSAVLPVLIVLAKDKASAVRKNAVSSFGQLEGPGIWQSHSSDIDITEASSHDKRSPEAVGVIMIAMRDDDKDVRSAASQSLTTLLPLDDSLITSLMVVTRYASDDAVIVALSRAFTTFGHKAAESQHFLIEVVKDKNVEHLLALLPLKQLDSYLPMLPPLYQS